MLKLSNYRFVLWGNEVNGSTYICFCVAVSNVQIDRVFKWAAYEQICTGLCQGLSKTDASSLQYKSIPFFFVVVSSYTTNHENGA